MLRVAVLGNAGGGKSTLARRLSAARTLPYFSVDVLRWTDTGQYVGDIEFAESHSEILTQEAWIIDGLGPWPTIELRIDLADTIIMIDLPLWRHCWWWTKRKIQRILFGKPAAPGDWPGGNFFLRVVATILRVHCFERPRLLDAIASRRCAKAVFWLRSPREIDDFLLRFA